jgi:hypothetical protein
MLDPTGVVVEKWILEGCFLTSLNFGDLNYSQDELATIDETTSKYGVSEVRLVSTKIILAIF